MREAFIEIDETYSQLEARVNRHGLLLLLRPSSIKLSWDSCKTSTVLSLLANVVVHGSGSQSVTEINRNAREIKKNCSNLGKFATKQAASNLKAETLSSCAKNIASTKRIMKSAGHVQNALDLLANTESMPLSESEDEAQEMFFFSFSGSVVWHTHDTHDTPSLWLKNHLPGNHWWFMQTFASQDNCSQNRCRGSKDCAGHTTVDSRYEWGFGCLDRAGNPRASHIIPEEAKDRCALALQCLAWAKTLCKSFPTLCRRSLLQIRDRKCWGQLWQNHKMFCRWVCKTQGNAPPILWEPALQRDIPHGQDDNDDFRDTSRSQGQQ